MRTEQRYEHLATARFEINGYLGSGEQPVYPAVISVAITEARAGRLFAFFDPKVLQALSAVYVEGSDAWWTMRKVVREANARVPLHDLERAVRSIVHTHAVADVMPNYSVTIGRALAHAKAGNARAVFGADVIASLAKLCVSSFYEWKRVRLQFKQVNKRIALRDLDRAVRSALRGSDSTSLSKFINPYVFDNPDWTQGEQLTYWEPLHSMNFICESDFAVGDAESMSSSELLH